MSTRPGTTTVVMVIDVQKAVMESAWDSDGVVARIRALIRRARSKQVPIVFVQHHDLDGDGLARGTDGWKFVEAVAPRDDDMLVEKNYPDSFADTELAGILAELGAGHLVIAGAQTDACIRATAHRALAEGYDVTLVEDCHTTEDATFDVWWCPQSRSSSTPTCACGRSPIRARCRRWRRMTRCGSSSPSASESSGAHSRLDCLVS